MDQNRKDEDVPNRQSNMEQAEGSRDNYDNERNRSSDSSSDRGSVMDDQESFEHGSGTSDVARGMGSSSERGMESERSGGRSGGQIRSGISNRSFEEERDEQSRLPERGRTQSEE
jgi:hypothetical protein